MEAFYGDRRSSPLTFTRPPNRPLGIRSPNSAQLVGSPFVHLDSGSFLGQEVDAVGVHTWAVSNTAAVRLTFRCGNSGHSQTFNMGLTPTGGVLFGPQVEGSASVYFNDNPGQKVSRLEALAEYAKVHTPFFAHRPLAARRSNRARRALMSRAVVNCGQAWLLSSRRGVSPATK